MKVKNKKIVTLLSVAAFSVLSSYTLQAEIIAIENVTIHTQSDEGVLNAATIVIEDGDVVEMGKGVKAPRNATVLDGTGKFITPGLIDAYSYLGLEEVSLESSTVDKRTTNKAYGAGFDISSAINPNSVLIPINRIEGITHAVAKPSNGHSAFAGLGAAMHLGNTGNNVIAPRVAMFASLDGAPEDASGGSRASTLLSIRSAFEDAKEYANESSAYATGAMRDLSISQADLDALQAVLSGDIPLVLAASRASDIKSAVQLAQDYAINLIISGAQEGWMVKDLLADNEVAVIVNTLANLPSSFNSLGARLDNAAKLNEAGVKVLISDGDSHNSRNIKQLAGNAAAHGMPWEDALDAISKNVANAFNLELLGEVLVGEKANLVLWDGEPLEVTTYADQVFIDGVMLPMVSRATLLRDRYMDQGEQPKAYVK